MGEVTIGNQLADLVTVWTESTGSRSRPGVIPQVFWSQKPPGARAQFRGKRRLTPTLGLEIASGSGLLRRTRLLQAPLIVSSCLKKRLDARRVHRVPRTLSERARKSLDPYSTQHNHSGPHRGSWGPSRTRTHADEDAGDRQDQGSRAWTKGGCSPRAISSSSTLRSTVPIPGRVRVKTTEYVPGSRTVRSRPCISPVASS